MARELEPWLRRTQVRSVDVESIHAFALLGELLDPPPIWSMLLDQARPPTDPSWIERIEPLMQCVPASPLLDRFGVWLHSHGT